ASLGVGWRIWMRASVEGRDGALEFPEPSPPPQPARPASETSTRLASRGDRRRAAVARAPAATRRATMARDWAALAVPSLPPPLERPLPAAPVVTVADGDVVVAPGTAVVPGAVAVTSTSTSSVLPSAKASVTL